MAEKILAWHGSADLKAEVLARLQAHREADDFIRGTYQRKAPDSPLGYIGCAIGCTLPSQNFDPSGVGYVGDDPYWQERQVDAWHRAVEEHYGIDHRIAALIDDIFESLDSREEAAQFAQDVAAAIPVGADLSFIAEDVAGGVYGSADMIDDDASPVASYLIADLQAAPVPVLTEV